MSSIRQAREFCFQFFFHLQLPIFENLKNEWVQSKDQKLILNSISDFKETTNTLLDEKNNDFVVTQINSTLENYESIETIIQQNLKNWKINRLSKVDHTNLLLSVNEICFTKTAPDTVIINEAIEISKKFGSKESSSFINGVLDSVAKSHDN